MHADDGYQVSTTREAMQKMGLPIDAELWNSEAYACGCAGTCDHGTCR